MKVTTKAGVKTGKPKSTSLSGAQRGMLSGVVDMYNSLE
jgi:hypothetical protein